MNPEQQKRMIEAAFSSMEGTLPDILDRLKVTVDSDGTINTTYRSPFPLQSLSMSFLIEPVVPKSCWEHLLADDIFV